MLIKTRNGTATANIFNGVYNSAIWKISMENVSAAKNANKEHRILAIRVILIDENITSRTFPISFFPLKKARYLGDPSWIPMLDIKTKMFNKTSASEKIPYSLWVKYLAMRTLSMNPKSIPMIVPIKTIPVPFAIFWRLWSTISDMVSHLEIQRFVLK